MRSGILAAMRLPGSRVGSCRGWAGRRNGSGKIAVVCRAIGGLLRRALRFRRPAVKTGFFHRKQIRERDANATSMIPLLVSVQWTPAGRAAFCGVVDPAQKCAAIRHRIRDSADQLLLWSATGSPCPRYPRRSHIDPSERKASMPELHKTPDQDRDLPDDAPPDRVPTHEPPVREPNPEPAPVQDPPAHPTRTRATQVAQCIRLPLSHTGASSNRSKSRAGTARENRNPCP